MRTLGHGKEVQDLNLNRGLAIDRTHAVVEARTKTYSRALASWFGVFLYLYALLHALPGMNASNPLQSSAGVWIATIVWLAISVSFVLASLGLWGFPGLAGRWQWFAAVGAALSAGLIVGSVQWHLWWLIPLDVTVLGTAMLSDTLVQPKERGWMARAWIGLGRVLGVAFLLYGAAVIVLRPVHQNWGATWDEVQRPLVGDQPGTRSNLINHVVSVEAPPEKVWPWIVQLGQDKAGFYSHDWLERAIGADIHNTYELRPEWQNLQRGDLIRGVQPDYLGGLLGKNVGWRVADIQPNRYMVLENWGTFWVSPAAGGSRFGVRTQVGNVPFWAAPIEVFLFEPSHFIMEQKMLREIKRLAEGQS